MRFLGVFQRGNDFLRVTMLPVDRIVQLLHFLVTNFSRQVVQRARNLWMLLHYFGAYYRNSLVRREIVTIVFQHKQVEGRDQAIGSIARDQIDLLLLERTRKQAKIHDARRLSEVKAVSGGESLEAVRTFHELIAESSPPMRRICRRLRDRVEMQMPRILTTNFDRERVIKSEWWTEIKTESLGIFSLNALIHLLRRTLRIFFQDGGKSSSRVFGINVNPASEHCLLADKGSRQIETALYRKMSLDLQVLGDQFAKNELLSKVL
jgi:hypothetical protein